MTPANKLNIYENNIGTRNHNVAKENYSKLFREVVSVPEKLNDVELVYINEYELSTTKLLYYC